MSKSYWNCWWCWGDCALPLRINLEAHCEGYLEIELQILFFNVSFTRTSEEFGQVTENLLEDIEHD